MTEVGDTIQIVRAYDSQKAGYRAKVREVVEIDGTRLFIIQWENNGHYAMLEPGFDQWINLGAGPPAKDMSKDANNYSQEALLGQRRQRAK